MSTFDSSVRGVVRRWAGAATLWILLPAGAEARTFLVDNAQNDGLGSLRQAILDANETPGWDEIRFDVERWGVLTIAPLSPLPPLAETVTVDGRIPFDQGDHRVELDGSLAGPGAVGLDFESAESVVRHLVVHGFDDSGIRLGGQGHHEVLDCRVGTDVSGTLELGNTIGIRIVSPHNEVSYSQVSGNSYMGFYVGGGDNRIERNVIGGDHQGKNFAASGSTSQSFGVQLWSSNNLVGSNSIAGSRMGIVLSFASHNVIRGNSIGVEPAGTARVGDLSVGILLELASNANSIGGPGSLGNRIANVGWQYGGVFVRNGVGNAIRGNRIWAIDPPHLAIDLDPQGVTVNDRSDRDTGPNNLQNSPHLASATSDGSTTLVEGSLASSASTSFVVDLYAIDVLPDSGLCEARIYLGAVDVLTDRKGHATFATYTAGVPLGQFVGATATATAGPSDTSEFSRCVEVVPPD